MPPRSVKMKRRILGFQRRVWWPKCTPASRSSRMETTDTDSSSVFLTCRRGGGGTGPEARLRERLPEGLSVSAGAAHLPGESATAEGLVAAADRLLYADKTARAA